MSILKGFITAGKVVGVIVTTSAAAVAAAGIGTGTTAAVIHATGNDPQQRVEWTEKSGPLGLRKKTYKADQNLVTGQLTGVRRVK